MSILVHGPSAQTFLLGVKLRLGFRDYGVHLLSPLKVLDTEKIK